MFKKVIVKSLVKIEKIEDYNMPVSSYSLVEILYIKIWTIFSQTFY